MDFKPLKKKAIADLAGHIVRNITQPNENGKINLTVKWCGGSEMPYVYNSRCWAVLEGTPEQVAEAIVSKFYYDDNDLPRTPVVEHNSLRLAIRIQDYYIPGTYEDFAKKHLA